MSLLKNREKCYIKAINNNNNNDKPSAVSIDGCEAFKLSISFWNSRPPTLEMAWPGDNAMVNQRWEVNFPKFAKATDRQSSPEYGSIAAKIIQPSLVLYHLYLSPPAYFSKCLYKLTDFWDYKSHVLDLIKLKHLLL